jgi:phenylalanyl-tRNA synthetase beta chain
LYRAKLLTGGRSGLRRPYPLAASGRGPAPISNIVDATNYVLFELGQPLHAFDRQKLAGNVVRGRNAAEGEKITTLDGQERQLTSRDLLICDAAKPVALAGSWAAPTANMDASSTEVLLEIAVFGRAPSARPPAACPCRAKPPTGSSAAWIRLVRSMPCTGPWRSCSKPPAARPAGEAMAEPSPIPRAARFRTTRASMLLGAS